MIDAIADQYRLIHAKSRQWPNLSNSVPVAAIQHEQTCAKSHLTESDGLDRWVRQSDVDYPIRSRTIFSMGPDYLLSRGVHADWMERQHDHHLQQSHDSNLTDIDKDHIQKLIIGGMEYGHDSGSADLTKFLTDAYKTRSKPSLFVRKHVKDVSVPPDQIDLTKVDSALGKNTFADGFHSFHGIGFHPGKLVGNSDMLHLPAYTSGSVNRNIALKYAKLSPVDGAHHVIHMVHPKDSTGVYIGNQSFHDNEVLLPRNLTLKIHPHESARYDVNGKPVHVWVAHRIPFTEI
jgi:hypothetical protein